VKRYLTRSIGKQLKNSIVSVTNFVNNNPIVKAYNEDFSSVSGILQFMQGFFNGTQLTSTPSLKLCETSVNNIGAGITGAYYQVANNNTAYSLCLGFDQILGATYNIDDATQKCYQGSFESYSVLKDYGSFASDPNFLATNLLYNFGYMYASVKDLIVYFSGGDKTQAKTAFEAGFAMGQILYYMLQENSVY
jgi:hypothetical protein